MGHEAAVGAVAVDGAMDDGADVAVGDGRRAVGMGYESGGELLRGVDVARRLEVADGGAVGVAERSAVLFVEGAP